MVEVEALAKRYTLGEDFGRYGYRTLRDALAGAFARRSPSAGSELWALRDVSFVLEEGDVLGVVGRNGAGKSTLLKLLARITEPTEGIARTRGRVGALLDVGTGFHPELTGRENVFLNGAILGMSRREIARRFDQIVDFAGVERFLDTPLKRYSAGMSLRLAFAVAAHVEPPVVVVDEVLAVGDAEFQRKCLGKMSELHHHGRTVVFVSHDLGAVRQLCPRSIWLDEGRIQADGATEDVLDRYLGSGLGGAPQTEFETTGGGAVELTSVSITGPSGALLDAPRRDLPFAIRVGFVTRRRLPNLDIAISLTNRQGVRVLDEAWSDTGQPPPDGAPPGRYEAVLLVPPALAAGDYVVAVWIGSTIGSADETFVDRQVHALHLWPHPEDRQEWSQRPRVVHPVVRWDLTTEDAESSTTQASPTS
jgi:ABC-2 type transport system ATP-binding protein/lipopolysaccharide transport system ATP-binding protein